MKYQVRDHVLRLDFPEQETETWGIWEAACIRRIYGTADFLTDVELVVYTDTGFRVGSVAGQELDDLCKGVRVP